MNTQKRGLGLSFQPTECVASSPRGVKIKLMPRRSVGCSFTRPDVHICRKRVTVNLFIQTFIPSTQSKAPTSLTLRYSSSSRNLHIEISEYNSSHPPGRKTVIGNTKKKKSCLAFYLPGRGSKRTFWFSSSAGCTELWHHSSTVLKYALFWSI